MFHQIVTAKDQWRQGNPVLESRAVVRSVFAVYHENNREGQLALLELMERLRIGLLRRGVLEKQFKLEYEAGLEYLIYPENIPPFYAGEMVSVWELPPVEREVMYGSEGYSNIKSTGSWSF